MPSVSAAEPAVKMIVSPCSKLFDDDDRLLIVGITLKTIWNDSLVRKLHFGYNKISIAKGGKFPPANVDY